FYASLPFFFIMTFIFGLLWTWGGPPQQILVSISSLFASLKPLYYMVLPLFCAAILAGYGFDKSYALAVIIMRKGKAHTRSLREFKCVFVFIAFVALSFVAFELVRMFLVETRSTIGAKESLLAYGVVGLSAATFIVLSAIHAPRRRTLLLMSKGIVVLFVAIHAVALYLVIQPIGPRATLDVGNKYYAKMIQDNGDKESASKIRTITPFSPQTNLYYGVGALNGYDSLYSKRTENFIDYINYPQTTMKLSEESHNAIYISPVKKSALVQNLGVKYIVSSSLDKIDGYSVVLKDGNYALHKSDRDASVIYFASQNIQSDESKQVSALKSGNMEYRQTFSNLPSRAYKQSDQDMMSYQIKNNSVEVTYKRAEPGLLFIGQTIRPQWKALLDDVSEMKTHQADYNMIALEVPSGSHTIRVSYEPMSFKIGYYISLTVLSMLVLALVLDSKKIRRLITSKLP
ncbi:MAG: YfhO family protein, partial [Microcoleus sp.]